MVISKITPQKRKGRYNIYVDGEFFSGIDDFAIVQTGLKEGMEIGEEKLKEVVFSCEVRSAFEKLVDLLSVMRSKKDLGDKLKTKGYAKEVIESALKKAEDYGYIDDREFAKCFAASKKNKSRLEIREALINKGIKREIIDEVLSGISNEDERNIASALAEKYMKNKPVDQKTLSNLYAFLARKGFGSEMISSIIRKYRVED